MTLAQCMYGCSFEKPTTFLTIHLPSLGIKVREGPGGGRCNHPGRHRQALGRGAQGEFRTAALKEYPSELCRLLAKCMWEGVEARARIAPRSWEVPQEALGFYIPLDPFCEFERKHDCARKWGRDDSSSDSGSDR